LPLKNGWLHGQTRRVSEGAWGLDYGQGHEGDVESSAQAIHPQIMKWIMKPTVSFIFSSYVS